MLIALIAVLVFLLDQATKVWIGAVVGFRLLFCEVASPSLNTGGAFSLPVWNAVLAGITAFIAILLVVWVRKRDSLLTHWERWGVGLILGGAMGNLLDRMTQSGVVDFIQCGTFPTFNIADSAICVGVVLMIIGDFIRKQKTHAK